MKALIIYPFGSFGSLEDEQFEIDVDVNPQGDLITDILEKIWRIMNVVDGSDFEMPQKLRCRSMCVGDYAVVDGRKFVVAGIGWREIIDGEEREIEDYVKDGPTLIGGKD